MHHTRRLGTITLAAILAAGLWGCGDDGGTVGPPPTHVDQGWSAFEEGDFGAAFTQFEAALVDDPADPQAFNGRAWVRLVWLDELDGAIQDFDAALDNGFAGADPNAGKALILRDREPLNYEAAIGCAETVLDKDADYVFAHDTSLDWRDMRLVLAHAHYVLGDYAAANTQVAALGGTPAELEEGDAARQLLQEIERLTGLYGG